MKYKNYSWDISNMEDYKMVMHEIDVIKTTYKESKVIEIHNNDGQVVAIMLEVY